MRIIPIFLMLLSGIAGAQNLVINPDFESQNGPAVKNFLTNDSFLVYGANGWSNPTDGSGKPKNDVMDHSFGTPDYYDTTKPHFRSKLATSTLVPHSGKAFCGIVTYWDDQALYREFIQGQLSSELIKGRTYTISMWLALHKFSSYEATAIGIYFSGSILQFGQNDRVKTVKPQVYIQTKGIFRQKDLWTQVTASFVANGTEKYFIVGNFGDTAAPKPESQHIFYSYNYIDDISITPVNETCGDRVAQGKKMICNDVNFVSNDTSLPLEMRNMLDKVVSCMKESAQLNVLIVGHTDTVGTKEANLNLSVARALAVRMYLVNAGIAEKRISTSGAGESEPISSNNSINRRVELKFSSK